MRVVAHVPVQNVPMEHDSQTVLVVVVHVETSCVPEGQIRHCEQTVSAVAEQEVLVKVTPFVHVEQGRHALFCM